MSKSESEDEGEDGGGGALPGISFRIISNGRLHLLWGMREWTFTGEVVREIKEGRKFYGWLCVAHVSIGSWFL